MYRSTQHENRNHYLATYDASGAEKYDAWIEGMQPEDFDACRLDFLEALPKDCLSEDANSLLPGSRVLDAGAGTGALCLAFAALADIELVALEPSPAMLERLHARSTLDQVEAVTGFCDHPDDQQHFPPQSFDFIVSRQLVNCLYDPYTAFENWFYWLKPGGFVVVMDGFYKPSAWGDDWDTLGRDLPLACCVSPTPTAYLLEQAEFCIAYAGPMPRTNALASTQTKRYMVIGRKE